MSDQLKHPVIISGGGLVGLTLAQYLERVGIPYLLFERDESPDARYGGWGISINWVTPALQKCLTPEAFCAIKALHNDPRTLEEGKTCILNITSICVDRYYLRYYPIPVF